MSKVQEKLYQDTALLGYLGASSAVSYLAIFLTYPPQASQDDSLKISVSNSGTTTEVKKKFHLKIFTDILKCERTIAQLFSVCQIYTLMSKKAWCVMKLQFNKDIQLLVWYFTSELSHTVINVQIFLDGPFHIFLI